jgi:hypothetical protein
MQSAFNRCHPLFVLPDGATHVICSVRWVAPFGLWVALFGLVADGANHCCCQALWGSDVKFGDKSTQIRGGLGPEVENRPESAQTGGAPRLGQLEK